MNKFREFENQKTELKVYAITLWIEGQKISEIAKELKKSRETIYRWIKTSDHLLARPAKRVRIAIDEKSKFKIIEAFILMGRPSMRELRFALHSIYLINFSESQLRRAIARWGLSNYRPSAVFTSMIRRQAQIQSPARPDYDERRAGENSPRLAADSSHPVA